MIGVLVLLAEAPAAPAGGDPVLEVLDGGLRRAVEDPGGHARLRWLAGLRPDPPDGRLQVVVEGLPGVDGQALAGRVAAIDGEVAVRAVAGSRVRADVPAALLPDLALLPGVARVRQPHPARPKVVTEGLAPMGSDAWQSEGLTGAGVRVGILDVGFKGYQDLLGTELPEAVETHFDLGTWDWDAHGSAVAEIVHDVAPDAELALYAFDDDVAFLQVLSSILDRHEVDVINASIGFDNVWHPDGTSPYAQAVDLMVEAGIAWVAAAGNEAGNYASGELAPSGTVEADGGELARIAGRSGVWVATWDGIADVSLRWSDPMEDAPNDLDLWVYDEDGNPCGAGQALQAAGQGTPPYEWVLCEAGTDWAWVEIWSYGAALDGLEAWIYSANGVDEADADPAGTLTLPADARGAIAVGAYHADTGELAWYSSQGPTLDGRTKPDVVAPTGVSTRVYGPYAAEGTSFSAPHVTGLVAQLLEGAGGTDPAETMAWLHENALDLGAPGPDDAYGWGAAHTGPLPEGCGCATGAAPGPALLTWLLGLLAAGRRRC